MTYQMHIASAVELGCAQISKPPTYFENAATHTSFKLDLGNISTTPPNIPKHQIVLRDVGH